MWHVPGVRVQWQAGKPAHLVILFLNTASYSPPLYKEG
jgi:hypothetical protein